MFLKRLNKAKTVPGKAKLLPESMKVKLLQKNLFVGFRLQTNTQSRGEVRLFGQYKKNGRQAGSVQETEKLTVFFMAGQYITAIEVFKYGKGPDTGLS